MKSPSNRSSRSLARSLKSRLKKRKHRQGLSLGSEQLEQRAMMAVYTTGGGPISNYLIVASDDASDVFIQRHAGGRLLISDNSSFLGTANATFTNASRLAIPDVGIATQSIAVTQDFGFSDLNVSIDITHPSVDHLAAVLVSPSGSRFDLVLQGSARGANFKDTIFDSDATNPIANGVAPYTATFRPDDSFSPLYTRSALGAWRLEVTDATAGSVGAITEFTLEFTPKQVVHEAGPPDILYVTNGRPRPAQGPMYWGDNSGELPAGGIGADQQLSDSTVFSLSNGSIAEPFVQLDVFGVPVTDPSTGLPLVRNRLFGELEYDGFRWSFEFNPVLQDFRFTQLTGGTPTARPVRIAINSGNATSLENRGQGVRGTLTVDWDSAVPSVPNRSGPQPPRIVFVSYYYAQGVLAGNTPVDTGLGVRWRDSNLAPSAGSSASFTFNVGDLGAIEGTVSGSISFSDVRTGPGAGGTTIGGLGFRTDLLSPNTLYFSSANPDDPSRGWIDWLEVTGSFSGDTITLNFVNRYTGDGLAQGPVTPGPMTLTVSMFDYVQDPNPNEVTFFAGHDLPSQLRVDLLTPNSTLNVDSRINVATPIDPDSNIEDIDLRATNINVNAEVITQDTFRVAPSRRGTAFAETLSIDSAVVAPGLFVFDVSNDPATNPNPGGVFDGPLKGRISLSPSGSLSGALATTAEGVSVPTAVILVRAVQTDMFVEGTIFGTDQTYLLSSSEAAQSLAPYQFVTRSAETGIDTGLIRGETVSITLGNDALTPLDQSIALNVLDLNTRIDSLRIKAATQQQTVPLPNPSASGPFPYELSIREVDDISFDAVAASGRPILLEAKGNIRFTSELATWNDVTIRANPGFDELTELDIPNKLTVSAPISTKTGQIRLEAGGVALNNSVRVTDSPLDDNRDDIWVTANAGNISLAGLVAANNRVKLEQLNPKVRQETPYSNRSLLQLANPGVVSQVIDVRDDFIFDDIDIDVILIHLIPEELILTLVAPDGRRFVLASRNGGRMSVDVPSFGGSVFDENGRSRFVPATFDSEAERAIVGSDAPFIGRYRPVDSLAPLYGATALGTWRLEIEDTTAGTFTGRLNEFTLRFITNGSTPSKIFGSARVQANELAIDAEGAVGDAALLPASNKYWLRTDVNTLRGRVGSSLAIDELNDLYVPVLRAAGFVSLRANGADPSQDSVNGRFGRKALTAEKLVDVTGLSVSAPSGSIDVLIDTARTIEIGNATHLRYGNAFNSVAAGNVRLRSTAGGMLVWDAPVAGGNARAVRVATSGEVREASPAFSSVTYAAGTPGVFPSTLRGRGDLSKWLGLDVASETQARLPALRVGDRILLKDQADKSENGVYVLSRMTTPTWGTGTIWTLTRAADSDTAAELPDNAFIRVMEGARKGFWKASANFVDLGGESRSVATAAGSDTLTLTAGDTSALAKGMVVFGAGIEPDTVVADIIDPTSVRVSRPATATVAAVDLAFIVPKATMLAVASAVELDATTITGLASTADLAEGMVVVGDGIPGGTTIVRIENNSTIIISNPAAVAGPVELRFVAPFATRFIEAVDGAVVTVERATDLQVGMLVMGAGLQDGTRITAIDIASRVITLSQAPIGDVLGEPLTLIATRRTNFGLTPIRVAAHTMKIDVGSDDPNDVVTFVVSTTGGTNNDAGSLGKMISLRQNNEARSTGEDAVAESQEMDFRFSAAVATTATPIRLTQELPEITKAFTIDGSRRQPVPLPIVSEPASAPVIDGARITLNRAGRALVASDHVSGLRISGSGAAGTVVSNVIIGGFARIDTANKAASDGVAIDVVNAPGVLVTNVVTGQNEAGQRLANDIAVRFSGAGTTSGTVLNSTILASNDDGIRVDQGASGVSLVGNTIGRLGLENGVGVRMITGVNQLGADPIGPLNPIAVGVGTKVDFTLPSNYSSANRLRVGLSVTGTGIRPTQSGRAAVISQMGRHPVTGVITVSISGGEVVADGDVRFSDSRAAVVRATRVTNMFTLPANYTGMSQLQSYYDSVRLRGQSVGVSGPGLSREVHWIAPTINALARDTAGNAYVTISRGTVTASGAVEFANFVWTERLGETLKLPMAIDMANVYLGMPIRGTGIAAGTTITRISGRTVTLSRPMTQTGSTAVTFGLPRRNVIQANRTGVRLEGGATTVTNSSVIGSNFSGILVAASGIDHDSNAATPNLHHRIGTASFRSAYSNMIYGNGGWGIFFRQGVSNDVKDQVKIEGNFLGTNSSAVVPLTFANKKGNIGHMPQSAEELFRGLGDKYVADPLTGLDHVEASLPSRTSTRSRTGSVSRAEANQHGRYQGSGGGSSGGFY